MRIELSFDDEEWEKVQEIFKKVFLKKGMSDSQPIKDKATFELRGPDGELKQREEGKSDAAG